MYTNYQVMRPKNKVPSEPIKAERRTWSGQLSQEILMLPEHEDEVISFCRDVWERKSKFHNQNYKT